MLETKQITTHLSTCSKCRESPSKPHAIFQVKTETKNVLLNGPQAAKCRSESDLVSAWVLKNRHYNDDLDEDDLKAAGEANNGSMNDDQDSKDSDLFFDFDIAPDEGIVKTEVVVTRDAATAAKESSTDGTAAASAGEISLASWDQKQQSSSERSSPTAVNAAAKKSPESPLVSPDSLLEEPVPDLLLDGEEGAGNLKSQDDSSDDEDDDKSPLTFIKGDGKHTVASSTLRD